MVLGFHEMLKIDFNALRRTLESAEEIEEMKSFHIKLMDLLFKEDSNADASINGVFRGDFCAIFKGSTEIYLKKVLFGQSRLIYCLEVAGGRMIGSEIH